MKIALVWLALISNMAQAHDSGNLVLPAYNEAAGANGRLRTAYQKYSARNGPVYPVQTAAVSKLLSMPLGDAIKILPIPAVLSDAEYAALQEGAQLRARTLVAFFADVMFNNGAKAIASGVITADQIDMIFKSENPKYNLDYLRGIWSTRTINDISVMYGPDVVRNPKGEFRVLEDNVGPIGGVGDLAATHNAFFGAELKAPLLQAVEMFLKDLPPAEWSQKAVVIYRKPNRKESDAILPEDHEDERTIAALEAMGLKILDVTKLTKDSQDLKDLVAGKYPKVVNLYSPFSLGEYFEVNEFLIAFKEKKFDLFTGPAVDAVGSKAMLSFMDKLTRVYLDKPAVLRTQPTKWLTGVADLQGLKSGWVVKRSNGSQGSQVYILDHLNDEGRENLVQLIRIWEGYSLITNNEKAPHYVMQELTDPSYIPADLNGSWVKFNVDFRPHVFIVNGEPLKPAIWGRASWKIPGVLNNVSQSAMEMVVTTPSHCERKLMSGAAPN